VLNLAPYSFFNAFNYIPPIVGFSSISRKDSLNNAEETGEFVWEPGDHAPGRGHEPNLRGRAARGE
jgi:flavin reductase (DIM6/NTAB) family NADH-FMN oxidoreductase RutF